MALRKLLLFLLIFAVIGAFLAAAAWFVLGDIADIAPLPADSVDSPDDRASLPEVNRTDAAEVLLDENGVPLRMADGSPFPPGSKRDGRRRVITPDGRVYVRDRGGDGWREATEDEGGAARGPPEFGFEIPPVLAPQPPAVGPRIRPPDWTAPTELTVDGAVVARPSPEPPLVRVGAGRPNLDVRRPRERDVQNDRDRERARVEEAAVIAQQGLRGDYYDFLDGQLHTIPDLAEIPPTFTRVDLTVDFSRDEEFRLPFHPETFAALWRGFLVVADEGRYEFTVGSDDGARLTIGEEVVIEHAGLRAHAESRGEIHLAAGRHPIELVFYENLTFASCRLFWDGPGFEREIVPASALAPPDDVASVLRPHITSIRPDSARVGDEVVLTGLGFSPESLFDRVTFRGVPAEVLEASRTSLRVVVPVGAETGDVLVQVGALSSLPRPFEVENLQGLFAEYFLIGSNLTEHPDLSGHTPYFVRLDGPLDFHQDGLWNLPYEPDVFATRMTGYLYVPATDEYTITLGSDDGTRVDLDGETFIDDPGLHSYRERSRTVELSQGFHPIAIHFFENRGVARLRLFWQRPGDLQRQVVPRGFLFPPEDVVGRAEPRLSKKALSGEVGEMIEIAGSAFGDEIGLVRVRFPGGVWVRPERVEGKSLSVRVPDGTDTGPLRVDVGVLSSNTVHFERLTAMGFTANYYVFSNETELIANATPEALSNRAINLTRVETSLDRTRKKHWDLPFPHRNVALHLRGRISMPVARRIGFLIQAEGGFLIRVDGRDRRSQPPLRTQHEESAWVDFSPGEHVVDIYHFHGTGDAVLRVFWTPWGLDDHRDVPARWFRP